MFIYKQYDQDSLNRQYNNRLHVPNFATHIERWKSLSRQTEKELPVVKDLPYGQLFRERLDIFPSSQPSSKTLVFIHGGYWQKFDKDDFQFIAKAFRADNITTVIINYPLAPEVSIDQIVISCRSALQWLYQNIAAYKGDPNQLFIAGHSAGGHLAAMLMATNWTGFNVSTDVIKGVCAVSGIFNMEPIRLSELNYVLKMDSAMALRNSPVLLSSTAHCSLKIVVGADETNEFQDQGQELLNCWKDFIPADLIKAAGLNHFSIVESILDQGSSLHHAIRRMMNI